jgi:hypothetical protein
VRLNESRWSAMRPRPCSTRSTRHQASSPVAGPVCRQLRLGAPARRHSAALRPDEEPVHLFRRGGSPCASSRVRCGVSDHPKPDWMAHPAARCRQGNIHRDTLTSGRGASVGDTPVLGFLGDTRHRQRAYHGSDG